MSNTSSYESRLGVRRHLKEAEKILIKKLLVIAKKNIQPSELDSMEVQEMSDGGMGSLYIVNQKKEAGSRKFGNQIAEFQYADADGVLISAALNVDKDDDLFELDVWKVDFSPVIELEPQEPNASK